MSYMAGTVAVTTGAVAVTGEGTAWLGAVAAGDLLVGPEGRSYPIAAVASNTALMLEVPYRGRTQVGGRYRIMPAVTGTPSVGVAALAARAEQAAAEAAAAALGMTNGSANISAASAALAGQQIKALQFDDRAAFAAASVPAWLREWSVKHSSGLLLSYLRDDAGTAIQSANGIKGRPAGCAMPEHFDLGAGVHAALTAWAALAGDHAARAGAVYVSAARTGIITFADGGQYDFQGATFRQDWILDNNGQVFVLGAKSRVSNLVWQITGANFHQRGAYLYEGAQAIGWRIAADTPFPAIDDNFDGGLIVRGPDVLIQDCDLRGHSMPIRMYDGGDQSRCRIIDCRLWDYKSGINLRGAGMVGGVIDGLYLYSIHPDAATNPGQNVVTEGAAHAVVRNVKQMFAGKGSGEHFIYAAVPDGTPGMRFESIKSNGSGQCFMKLRGHDGAQLTDCHGGMTSVGNVPGTNEDGFRFEHCRNIRGRDLSVRSDDTYPSGYDGVHLSNCWNMDLAAIRFGRCHRAYVRAVTPAALADHAAPPNNAVENITIDGLFARGATTKPLLSLGSDGGGSTVTVGNITIRDVDWDGAASNLVAVDAGVTLVQLPGTAIRISGITAGVPFEYVRAAGAAPVYSSLVAQPADPAVPRTGAGTVNLPNCADLNDNTLANGFYRTVGGVLNWAGLPQEWGCLQVLRTPNRITQLWYNDNTASFSGTVFRRMWDSVSASWTPWYRMLDSRSAVGAITRHTDGQPTGPIIERGTNTNGEYIKFADGTMICWHAVTTLTTGGATVTFPAAFSTTTGLRTVLGVNSSEASAMIPSFTGRTVTGCEVSCFNTSNARIAKLVEMETIGRWF